MSEISESSKCYSIAVECAQTIQNTKNKNMHKKLAQFEVMVQFMQDHPQLGKGHVNTLNAKNVSNNLWKSLASSLNKEGPPTRDVAGWKKVWADYKNHLKAKMRKNKCSFANTGGGPTTYCPLTPLEGEVVRLLSIEEAVSGNSGERFCVAEEIVVGELQVNFQEPNTDEMSQTVETIDDGTNFDKPSTSSHAAPFRRRTASNPSGHGELLKMQVENQKQYHQNPISKLTEICDSLKDASRNLRKLREIKEKKLKHRMQVDLEKLQIKRELLELKKKKALNKATTEKNRKL